MISPTKSRSSKKPRRSKVPIIQASDDDGEIAAEETPRAPKASSSRVASAKKPRPRPSRATVQELSSPEVESRRPPAISLKLKVPPMRATAQRSVKGKEREEEDPTTKYFEEMLNPEDRTLTTAGGSDKNMFEQSQRAAEVRNTFDYF
jgi:hypothetical protein